MARWSWVRFLAPSKDLQGLRTKLCKMVDNGHVPTDALCNKGKLLLVNLDYLPIIKSICDPSDTLYDWDTFEHNSVDIPGDLKMDYFTMAEAADTWGISRQRVAQLIAADKIQVTFYWPSSVEIAGGAWETKEYRLVLISADVVYANHRRR